VVIRYWDRGAIVYSWDAEVVDTSGLRNQRVEVSIDRRVVVQRRKSCLSKEKLVNRGGLMIQQRGSKMKKQNQTCNETCMKTALLFIAGGMVGATLALLFAPQSGKKTRGVIQEAGEELVGKAEALQEDLSERMAALVEDALVIAEQGLDKGKGMTEKVQEDLLSTLHTSKDLISRQIERAQHLVHK